MEEVDNRSFWWSADLPLLVEWTSVQGPRVEVGSLAVFGRVLGHCELTSLPRYAGVEWCFSDRQLSGEVMLQALLAPLAGEACASRYRTAGWSSGMIKRDCGEVWGGGRWSMDGAIALLWCSLRRGWLWPVRQGRRYCCFWARFESVRQTRSDMLILWKGPRYWSRWCEDSRRDPDRSKASRFGAGIRAVYSCPGWSRAQTGFVEGTQTHCSRQPAICDHGRS